MSNLKSTQLFLSYYCIVVVWNTIYIFIVYVFIFFFSVEYKCHKKGSTLFNSLLYPGFRRMSNTK